MSRSEELFQRAVKVIPGGVNSPVRAYGSVGMNPRFVEGATGPYLFDADGNKYIDYICSWGPMILGHNNQEILKAVIRKAESGLSFGAATEIEVEMAEFICENIPSVEMIRMVNSGTEAVMSAIRAARGYTGRNKIIKFAGCYHGHSDALLVKAGSGVMTAGVPDSAGVPEGCTKDTLTAVYNDLESVKKLFEEYSGEIAAVIVEPVAANMGVVLPEPGFLEGLRRLCTDQGYGGRSYPVKDFKRPFGNLYPSGRDWKVLVRRDGKTSERDWKTMDHEFCRFFGLSVFYLPKGEKL